MMHFKESIWTALGDVISYWTTIEVPLRVFARIELARGMKEVFILFNRVVINKFDGEQSPGASLLTMRSFVDA